jgi:hypothetical protein
MRAHLNSALIILVCPLACGLSGCSSYVINGANTGSLFAQPSSVRFGTVSIGQTASTAVSLVNVSSAPVEITQLNLTGQPFSIVGSTNLPTTIGAGGTYALNVQFDPTAAGMETGQLTIVSNSTTSGTTAISLSGTGATGLGSAALSLLSCSSGTITGASRDVCAVTLNSAAPGGGLSVNLSSGNSAVTVQNTVFVPANATSAEFTAIVSAVATAQTVTMTARAGGVSKNISLQLNAALLALSINATSVAFGDVVVNTPATQPVTLTSTGTLPLTIDAVTLTGAGFTVSGPQFPAVLNPSQETTLNVEFDPAALGAATGQLGISSNASTSSREVIGLSGTGTSASAVSVAVTPTSALTTVGASQQFAASVTGATDTAVTWAATGMGCIGTTCGTISSTGLYTAPDTAPSPAVVSIAATSVSDPSKSASASVKVLKPSGATYYLAPASAGGDDSNTGLSAVSPWLTPNHAVKCGDVLMAIEGAYSNTNFQSYDWGTVTCPAGNNVAWIKCATFDACKISSTNGKSGVQIGKSYWGIQGFEATTTGGNNYAACFNTYSETGANIHHIIFANNVANGCGASGIALSNTSRTASYDYVAIIGNIAYNAAQSNTECYSGIGFYQPIAYDSLPGTHLYIAGNFSWDNVVPDPCGGLDPPYDGEGFVLDTLDGSQGRLASPYSQQIVVESNIAIFNGNSGISVEGGGNTAAPVYIRNNTVYGNNKDANQRNPDCGQVRLAANPNTVESSQVFGNLSMTSQATGGACGTRRSQYVYSVYNGNSTDAVYGNFGYSAAGNNTQSGSSSGFTFGSDNTFGTNPAFANPVDPGAPKCSGYSSVPACMATVIANFTPTNATANTYGYQMPRSTTLFDPLYPQWLCSVTNLPMGLVTPGCAPAGSAHYDQSSGKM